MKTDDGVDTPGHFPAIQQHSADRLRSFLTPRSIAIVGASETAFWSRNALLNLPQLGFGGTVVAVNPKRSEVLGFRCVPNLRSVQTAVDLAYVATAGHLLPEVIADAQAAGVRNLVIVAAGFGETGEDGARLQRELSMTARASNMIFLGPNCPGFINLSDGVAAYGQGIPSGMPKGGVAIVLQSGALASGVLKFAHVHDIGISKLVCMGNEAMVDVCDIVSALIDDEHTRSIALFLEQFRDGPRFMALARKGLERGKPIVALKAGRTPAGMQAALAHTGALAGDDAVAAAAMRQTGVIRVQSLEQMLVTAAYMANGPLPRGGRIGVITGSGGACDIMADRASDEGLELRPWSEQIRLRLKVALPSFATILNPLDCAAVDTVRVTGTSATPMDEVTQICSAEMGMDALLYMGFNMIPVNEPEETVITALSDRLELFVRSVGSAPTPVIPIAMTSQPLAPFAQRQFRKKGLWLLPGMDLGLTAVGHAAAWIEKRKSAHAGARDTLPSGQIDPDANVTPWSEARGRTLLESAAVPMVPGQLARTKAEALEAAERLGYPIAAKVCSASIPHKSDIGGIALSISGADELARAYEALTKAGRDAAGDDLDGILITPMRPRGLELFAGVTVDKTFGPVLAVGMGGIWIEIMKDVQLRVLPVLQTEISDMIRSLRGADLLRGARNTAPLDIDNIARAVARIADAALSLGSRLHSLEVNPLWCLGDKVEALDVLVHTREADLAGGPG